MNYKYKSLLNQGFIKIDLSKAEHKNIFGHDPKKHCKYEYYEDKSCFVSENYSKFYVKLLNILLYPALLLIAGLGNIKELNEEISDLFHERERGKFWRDYSFKADLIKKNKGYIDHFID